MLNVRQIELREIALKLREPFRISSGEVFARRIFLLRLIDQQGAEAWSECVAGEFPNYSPETVETAWLAVRDWLAPLVLGRRFTRPQQVWPVLNENIRGHQMAKAAVEMAMWELAARLQELPLAKLIGGTRDKIATGISLGIQKDPGALVEKAQAALAAGYRKVKIKIKPGADIAYVRAVREALGPEAPLMADANNAYTLADIETLRALDAFKLIMIEQPLAWDDLRRHATLQAALQTPLCLDESITSPERAEDMIALGSGRIINIKPGRVGGFLMSKAIHDLCLQNGIPVWCGGMLESGIGRAYNVALASLPNFKLPGDVSPSSRYWQHDIVAPEWTMNGEGLVTVPLQKAGIGVEIDRDRVENLTVRVEAVGARR